MNQNTKIEGMSLRCRACNLPLDEESVNGYCIHCVDQSDIYEEDMEFGEDGDLAELYFD